MDEVTDNLEDMMRSQIAATIARSKDQVIMDALRQHLGGESPNAAALVGRCERVVRAGVPGETFCLDGVPFLWVSDLQFKVDGNVATTSFDHKTLPARSDVHPK